MWMWPAAVLAVASVALVARVLTTRGRARRAWGDAANQLSGASLQFEEGLQTLGGVLDGVTVSVSVHGSGGGRHTRIAATTDAPDGFELRARAEELAQVPEITGDAAFDATVASAGPRVAGTAILDASIRRQVLQAVALGVRVEKGAVVVLRPGVIADGAALVIIVRVVAELARRLADAHRDDRVARLVRVATSDPLPGVRKRALRILIDHYAEDPSARSALDRALVDADAEVRLMGAAGVGPGGFEAIRHIANDKNLPANVRADAIEKLVTLFPRSQSAPALAKALDDPSSAARKVAIVAIGKMRHAAATPRLVALANRPAEAEEQACLAQALGRIGDPSSEAALLRLLAVEETPVRVAAANALARIGGAAAVEPLAPHAASLIRSELKKAATDAIAKIQARLAHAGGAQGQLAMSDPDSEEGQVSLPVQDGALDLPDGDAPPKARQKIPAGS